MSGRFLAPLKKLSNSAVGDRLKALLNIRVPKLVRPMQSRATVSDLFPWRVDAQWETRFELMNLPALLNPQGDIRDTATLVLFDQDGRKLSQHTFSLTGPQHTSVLIEELLDGHTGAGSFSVFHESAGNSEPTKSHGAFLTERNYLALKRRGDPLWSYVHGNTHALSKSAGSDRLGFLGGHRKGPFCYRPQLRFDDCDKFELLYLNPTRNSTNLDVRLFDATRNEVDRRTQTVPPLGLGIVAVDNADKHIVMVEAFGRVEDWRPVLIKYHSTHFNVLHS